MRADKGVLREEAETPEPDSNGGVAVATDEDEAKAEETSDVEATEEADSN